jgi:TRAP-type C4-dicarboxylate transport system permease small subunit
LVAFFYRPARREPAPLRVLGDAIDVAIVLLGASLIALMSMNVLSRAVLNADIAWNTEFGEFTLVWATFLGGAAAARRGAHMRITELLNGFAPAVRRVVEVATRTLVLVLLALVVVRGATIVERTFDQQMSVLYWPVGLQYLAMPVGSGLAFVFVAYETFQIVFGAAAFDQAQD